MKYLRLFFSASLALLVTGGLLFLMLSLIQSADYDLNDKPSRKLADIYMPEREIEAQTKAEKPNKPDEPVEPPPEFSPPEVNDFDPSPAVVDMTPSTQLDLNISMGDSFGSAGGEYLPIVKINPKYPRRALRRNIEGYCTVQFTVTTSGSVKDPEPVDCMPEGVFEKSSMAAAMKFKYKPRVINGKPEEVAKVRNRFTFQIDSEG